jgi:predicted Zn-dependent protease
MVQDSTFYHSGLRFVVAFPQDWTVTNSATQVAGRAPGGSAEGLIELERQDAVKGQSPKEYVKETLKRDDLLGGEEIEVNGFKAYVAPVDVAGGKEKAAFIAVIFKDSGVYYFKGEAGEKGDAQAFEAAFRATVTSFRAMKASDMESASKQRIRVIEAKPGDTYRSLAQQSALKSHAEATLRTLNGDYPVREPRPGDLIKIVQ